MRTQSSSARFVATLLGGANLLAVMVGVSAAARVAWRERVPVAHVVPSAGLIPSERALRDDAVQTPPAAKTASSGPATATAAAPAPKAAAPAATIPIAGKGMWIYQFGQVGGGDPHAIVAMAKQYGLSHLYVRAGSSMSGLNTWPDIAKLLPIAHAAGIKVIAWYFPYLENPGQDAQRSLAVIRSSVHGHTIDGFAADIETPAEGTFLTKQRALAYIRAVRKGSGHRFLILVPPRPTSHTLHIYPYGLLVPRFDAVAPMVYWGFEAPEVATAKAISFLRQWHRPVAPIGQAYDMGPEGGPPGRPTPAAILRFMREADLRSAIGVSFWSWQHSALAQWSVIRGYNWTRGGPEE